DAANEYFASALTPDDAVASYAGVRPLYDNKAASNSTVTRDYQFELDQGESGDDPPILSIFGGKITTYRKLAEHALSQFPDYSQASWTADELLPGANFDSSGFDGWAARMRERYPFLSESTVLRLCRAYGKRMVDFLGRKQSINEMGTHLGGDLYAAELRYLIKTEFARSAEDVLKRRSKLYLHLCEDEQARVHDWFEREFAPAVGAVSA
ncbi:MAG: glycerol-3-phosphate dehydrogenase C-terminal domain-containing protein, partial [Pseudomonadota bacterium]